LPLDGKATRLLAQLAKIQLLIVDDWVMARLTAEQRRDLMEVVVVLGYWRLCSLNVPSQKCNS
jgi:DNA replication protein DnaC